MNQRRWLCVLALLTMLATVANIVAATEILVGCWEIGICGEYTFCENGLLKLRGLTLYECREGGFWYYECDLPVIEEIIGTC